MPTDDLQDTLQEVEASLSATPAVSEFDLRPPPLRSGFVLRDDLVHSLRSTNADVILLTAPSGYGKSTVLAQWASVETTPLAWLSLGREENSAKTLLFHLAASMGRAGFLTAEDVATFQFMGESEAATHGANHLTGLLRRARFPRVMVVDNIDVLKSRAAKTVIEELVRQLEAKIRFAFAGRSEAAIRFPGVRARGRLLEITDSELALSVEQTGRLIARLGLDTSLAGKVVDATDGWPVAAVLIATAARDRELDLTNITIGEERHLTEFMRSEILPGLSRPRRRILTLISPLARISGPLTDAITDSEGSQRLLQSIMNDTHLIHRVDHDNTWFEMNRVLRTSLLAELERNDPETLQKVHLRAAQWFEDNDMPAIAIEHARQAGDVDTFARLMSKLVKRSYAEGDEAAVFRWMSWLGKSTDLDRHPELAAVGALAYIQEGDALAAETWADAAFRGSSTGEGHPAAWLVQALMTHAGTSAMIIDAQKARATMSPGSEWMPAALLAEGLAHTWDEEFAAAEPLLAESATLGEHNESWPTTTLALAERGLIALSRHEWDVASHLTTQSVRIIDAHGLDGYVTSGLGLVVAARCARHGNEIVKATTLLARSASVRPRLNTAIPGLAVQTLIEMARAHLELSDVSGARTLIREAGDVLAQRPDLGRLPDALEGLRETVSASGPGKVGPTALTKAELRLLPLLATNLSFPEIGEQLYISRHTVKSQAMSIYRKLGTSSRSDAITKAHEIGLLAR